MVLVGSIVSSSDIASFKMCMCVLTYVLLCL